MADTLVNKIMDIFIYKYEKKLKAGHWYGNFKNFDTALSVIYQDTIKDILKNLFIDLCQ